MTIIQLTQIIAETVGIEPVALRTLPIGAYKAPAETTKRPVSKKKKPVLDAGKSAPARESTK